MTHRTGFLVLCLALLSAPPAHAKGKIAFTPKGDGRNQSRPASCEVQVFQGSRPDTPFVELGTIDYHDERHRSRAGSLNLEAVLPTLKARACQAGAEALVDVKVTEVRRLEFAMFHVRATVVRLTPN